MSEQRPTGLPSSRARSWLRRLAPPGADHDTRLRARVFLVYGGLLIALSLGWGGQHLSLGSRTTGLLFVVAGLAGAGILVWLYRTRRLWPAMHAMIGAALAATTLATVTTGGLRLTNICPFFMMVIAPIFLLGRAGRLWALASVAVALALQGLTWLGVSFPDDVPPQSRALDAFVTWSSSLLMVLMFTLFYDRARTQALRRVSDASQAKSLFLANLGHEVRTPLHGILNLQQALADTLRGEESRQLLRRAQRATEGLQRLLGDLLDTAAIEGGRFSLLPERFELPALVASVADWLREECAAQGLVLALDAELEGVPPLLGDARRLRQVLINLGSNAVKFTHRGRVALRVRTQATADGTWLVRFAVEDSGVGIPPEELERIFESFAQLDASAARRHPGAGLGLFICRELVRLMDGRIQVRSAPGQGSCFEVEVSLRPAPEHVARAGAPVSGLNVLVVEDNVDNQFLARRALRRLGHDACLATDGEAAVEVWHAQRPDLILMDIHMPGVDGLEATRRIRAQERARGLDPVPIIAVSGQPPLQRRSLRELGIQAWLLRPFSTDQLADAIARVQDGVGLPG